MTVSTLLDQVVTPALFFKFGRKVYEHKAHESAQEQQTLESLADSIVPPGSPDGSADVNGRPTAIVTKT